MVLSTAKLTELPHHILFTFSIPLRKPPYHSIAIFQPFSSSLRSNRISKIPFRKPNISDGSRESSGCISQWASPSEVKNPRRKPVSRPSETNSEAVRTGTNAIDRIVLRLRNLGLGSDYERELGDVSEGVDSSLKLSGLGAVTIEDEKLGDLLKRDWIRPDTILTENDGDVLLPWERTGNDGEEMEEDLVRMKKRALRAPTLADLTIEDVELRRLRRMGMSLRERINVPKAGITSVVLEKIHDRWRKCELVRLKFHEDLAHDMKTAHEIVERRTGGLVTWRSGSVMLVYRGTNYEGPISKPERGNSDSNFVPTVSSSESSFTRNTDFAKPVFEKFYPVTSRNIGSMTEEEVEYNCLLDGLGPRFEDWWGTGVLPVDADLLPPSIPGYKTPFRLLPTGMRPRLTNAEMTNLRKIAKSLPCHFALGRNRNHQGLATTILKIWEKSLVVKIAVKRGIQNTNNEIMAEELKVTAIF